MKIGESETINGSLGIANVKIGEENVFCILDKSKKNIEQKHLGYIFATGNTREEALINALKKLKEDFQKMEMKIKEYFEFNESYSNERVIISKDGKAIYEVDEK